MYADKDLCAPALGYAERPLEEVAVDGGAVIQMSPG
jgi:hypothetical protein